MKLYKFVKKEHLEAFFDRGSIRLSTIHEFRDVTAFGKSRQDSKEGVHTLKRTVGKAPVSITSKKKETLISESIRIQDPNLTIQFKGITFTNRYECEDALIFCSSHCFSEDLFHRWHDTEGTDSCYEITDALNFVKAINKKLKDSAYFALNSNILYIDEPADYQSPLANVHPGIIKNKREYGWQVENRSVWFVKNPYAKLDGIIIEVPEAREFSKPFSSFRMHSA